MTLSSMKNLLIAISLIILPSSTFGQTIKSGDYDGLVISFDKTTSQFTAYFEDHTGWDESTESPKFSCVFYLEGVADSTSFEVKTYYPGDQGGNEIAGRVQILNDSVLTVSLSEEHGGCWNVRHFADEPVNFTLSQENGSMQVRYVTADKAYFHAGRRKNKKTDSFVNQDDIVSVKKIKGKWAYCCVNDEKSSSGWIKLVHLNEIGRI